MAHHGPEIEIKLAARDVRSARRLLRDAGFRVLRRRVFETNRVFDTADLALRASSRLLRVRQAGRLVTLTFKGPPVPGGRHKEREEIEMQLPAAEVFTTILERLSYRQVFCYEKFRTEFALPSGKGVATLDETPIGIYLELEGAPAWIDRTARRLGFAETDYITASYGRLYLDWCAANGVEPSNMQFDATSLHDA